MKPPSQKCVASTIEHPDKLTGRPYGFEVVCSIHGHVCSYNVMTVREVGAKEVQRMVDRAWLLHAPNEAN